MILHTVGVQVLIFKIWYYVVSELHENGKGSYISIFSTVLEISEVDHPQPIF